MSRRGVIVGTHLLLPASVVARWIRASDRSKMLADPVLAEWMPSFTEAVQRWQSAVEGGSDSRTVEVRTSEPNPSSEWVNVAEAALLAKIGPRRVLALIHGKKLPAVRRGRGWWIRRADVTLLIENRRTRG